MVELDFPDISNNNGPFDLGPYAAAIAKATEGASFVDTFYAGHRDQAAAQGKPFMGYHWVDTDDMPGQAANAYAVVGHSTPLMLDAEALGADVAHLLAFVGLYRALGGRVTNAYFPRWWWQNLGQPSLLPLAAVGLSLISSDYDIHSGPSPLQWTPYGGLTPVINQWTSRGPGLVDSNRFLGTVDELRAVFEGSTTGMGDNFLIQVTGEPNVWLTNGFRRREIADAAEADQVLTAKYGPITTIPDDRYLQWIGGFVDAGPPTAAGGPAMSGTWTSTPPAAP